MTAVGGLERAEWLAERGPLPTHLTVGDVMGNVAHRDPHSLAAVAGTSDPEHGTRRWTFAELQRDGELVARWLLERFEPGDPIATCTPNGPAAVVLQIGVALAGMVLVPLNPSFRRGELDHALGLSGAVAAFVEREFRDVPLAAVVADLQPGLPQLADIITLDDGWAAELDDALAATSTCDALPAVSPDDLAQLQFTSGTTGPAKGVYVSHLGMAVTSHAFAERLGIAPGGVWVDPMPLFHTAGNVLGVMGALWNGSAHVTFPFTAERALDEVERHRATLLSASPTLLHAMLSHPTFGQRDLASLDAVFTGGMTVGEAFVDTVESAFGAPLTITFGMTETCGSALMTSATSPAEVRRTSTGWPLPHTDVRIVDATGAVAAIGEPGELCVRGERLTRGYHLMPEQTAAVLGGDGWLRTGDQATMDDDGICRIVGRLKDMIKTGGENVTPDEVEACLMRHAGVRQAAIVGHLDDRWGELVTAFVILDPAAPPTIDELIAHCRTELAPFKQPREWHVVDDLPTTASGKVQRALLREQLTPGESVSAGHVRRR